MEIKDFKEITEKHVEICKKIIREDGCCDLIACFECPFYNENSLEFEGCQQYGENNESFVKSAKEFIELYSNKNIKVDEKATAENFKKENEIKIVSSSECFNEGITGNCGEECPYYKYEGCEIEDE